MYIHDTLLPKQRSSDAQVYGKWWNCRKDRKGQEERRGRALGNTAKLRRPWRRCKQQPTSGRTKGARLCKLEPEAIVALQKSMPAAAFSCAAQPLQQMLSGFPRGSVIPVKPLRSTDASPLSEVKRSVQERESGDTELLPRVKASVQKGGKSETVSVCAVCLALPKAVLRLTGFGHPVQ